MLQKLKKNKKKGFTLAELLIVVAILAILMGIAIPVYMNQMNNVQTSVYEANLRSAKSMAATSYLVGRVPGAADNAEPVKMDSTQNYVYTYSLDSEGNLVEGAAASGEREYKVTVKNGTVTASSSDDAP